MILGSSPLGSTRAQLGARIVAAVVGAIGAIGAIRTFIVARRPTLVVHSAARTIAVERDETITVQGSS